MITRYLSSAGIGILITTALLWSMNALIDLGEIVGTTPPRIVIQPWNGSIDDTPIETTIKPPEKVVEAKDPPPLLAPSDPDPNTIPVVVTRVPTTPVGPGRQSGLTGNIDSALINIINAQPEYPVAASQKGLEGYVIVQFDVTELGTVENVQVVETSSSTFNKAAIKAAYRSKYKPKTVDGVAYRSQGLRKLYRFEMKS